MGRGGPTRIMVKGASATEKAALLSGLKATIGFDGGDVFHALGDGLDHGFGSACWLDNVHDGDDADHVDYRSGPRFYSAVGAHNVSHRNVFDAHIHDFGDHRVDDSLRSRYEIPQGQHGEKSL